MKPRIYILLVSLLFAGCLGRPAAKSGNASGEIAVPEPATADRVAAGVPDGATADSLRSHFERQGPFVENDTLFLYAWRSYDSVYHYTQYCRVYVEKNRESASYRQLDADASLDTYRNREILEQNLTFLRQSHPRPFGKYGLPECPGTWIPIGSFHGELYVDMLENYPVWITDSLFIRQMMDGPYPSQIDTAERINPAHFRFRTSAGYPDVEQVDIRIVDPARKIAVFSFGDRKQKNFFRKLYAPLETARQLDLAEWDCSDMPLGNEVEWDEIDFDALISGAATLPETVRKTEKNR